MKLFFILLKVNFFCFIYFFVLLFIIYKKKLTFENVKIYSILKACNFPLLPPIGLASAHWPVAGPL
jgi:hypothetical protein